MNKKIIAKVRKGGSPGTKLITIPVFCDIQIGEYVTVELLSFEKENENLNSPTD